AGEEVHRYDARGNLSETVVRDARGATLSRTVYEYEFDEFGNWVKQTASVAVLNAGKSGFEPVEITNRRITYYQTGAGTKTIGAKTSGSPVAVDDSVPTTNEERRGAHADAESARQALHADGERASATPRVDADARRTAAPADAEARRTYTRGGATSQRAGSSGAGAQTREVKVGTLNDRATSLPRPAFPVMGKRLAEPVTVSVEVVVDQTGRVVEAKAQNGPLALRESAEAAARRATFFPFYEEGRPVRARGWLNFGFLFEP
ncbi:MAG: energy transducer TonB, partial [Pyrinomonadaceae bacterium]